MNCILYKTCINIKSTCKAFLAVKNDEVILKIRSEKSTSSFVHTLLPDRVICTFGRCVSDVLCCSAARAELLVRWRAACYLDPHI